MKIRVKYHDAGIELSQAHAGEWIDLMAAEDTTMWVGDFAKINLGVAIELPEGYEAIVAPRSSTFEKYGIIMTNGIGVIDNIYCGDDDIWRFPALKVRGEPVTIKKYDRIAQFRIQPVQGKIDFDGVQHLCNANRGGFGSTGR